MTSIKVCLQCFGRRVKRHMRHGSDKSVEVNYFPLVIDWVCEDCGYKGIPIVFCNEEDYVEFVAVHEKNKDEAEKKESEGDEVDDPGLED